MARAPAPLPSDLRRELAEATTTLMSAMGRVADLATRLPLDSTRAGHTGALYRACNWLWAPTWHRLRPPPTGNGAWTAEAGQSVKDRWVFPLAPDDDRAQVLAVKDDSVNRRMPWAQYREPVWSRGSFRPHTGGGDYKQFAARAA